MKIKSILIILIFAVGLTAIISQGADSSFKLEPGKEARLDLSLLNESRHSLEIAFKYFCDSQQTNGSWKHDPAITALVLYSFMLEPAYNPDDKTDEAIRKGYAFLAKFVKPDGGIYHEQYRNSTGIFRLLDPVWLDRLAARVQARAVGVHRGLPCLAHSHVARRHHGQHCKLGRQIFGISSGRWTH